MERSPPILHGGNHPCGLKKSCRSRTQIRSIGQLKFSDSSITVETRADIGIDHDCIYTAGGAAGPSRAATSTELADHVKAEDSFLVGPYGERE